jgi:phage baseplate assembly protein W
MMAVSLPYRVDGRGRTAEAENDESHIRDLIETVLFSVSGERVNRPDFGCDLMQFVFAPNSVELAATLQALVQGSIQQWLGNRISVDQVLAESVDSTLSVEVRYTVLATQTSRTASFTRKVSS